MPGATTPNQRQKASRSTAISGLSWNGKSLGSFSGSARSLDPLTLPTTAGETAMPTAHLVALTPAPTDGQGPLFSCTLLAPLPPVTSISPNLFASTHQPADCSRFWGGSLQHRSDGDPILEAVLLAQPRGPYRLGGWCGTGRAGRAAYTGRRSASTARRPARTPAAKGAA